MLWSLLSWCLLPNAPLSVRVKSHQSFIMPNHSDKYESKHAIMEPSRDCCLKADYSICHHMCKHLKWPNMFIFPRWAISHNCANNRRQKWDDIIIFLTPLQNVREENGGWLSIHRANSRTTQTDRFLLKFITGPDQSCESSASSWEEINMVLNMTPRLCRPLSSIIICCTWQCNIASCKL